MRPVKNGFTLIELLTVVFIISLLIAILLPSLNQARIQAKRTTVEALFHAIDAGMEMFRNDVGQYPYSNAWEMENSGSGGYAVVDGTNAGDVTCSRPGDDPTSVDCNDAQGAHLLADAMLGRDLLGYDPGAGPSARWDSDAQNNPNPRLGPYIKPDTAQTETVFRDAAGKQLGEITIQSGNRTTTLRFLVDVFGSPVLYFRANPNAQVYDSEDVIYLPDDNWAFIHETVAPGNYKPSGSSVPRHLIYDTAADCPPTPPGFYEYILDRETSEASGICRPYNPDTYILMSAGPNRIWGDKDDVVNFRKRQ